LARSSATKPVNERCWTIIGCRQGPFWYGRRRRPITGDPASVEFDAAWVLLREETLGDVVGFCHTHPAGPSKPSRRDIRTMRAWSAAFGKPLLCLIETPEHVAAFRFDDDRSDGTELAACEMLARGVVIALDESVKG
jgi:hypothetical protein